MVWGGETLGSINLRAEASQSGQGKEEEQGTVISAGILKQSRSQRGGQSRAVGVSARVTTPPGFQCFFVGQCFSCLHIAEGSNCWRGTERAAVGDGARPRGRWSSSREDLSTSS